MERTELSLMDWMLDQVRCDYLSDLRRLMSDSEGHQCLRTALEGVCPERWTLEGWSQLIHYLTGVDQRFHTQEEALQALRYLIGA